MSESSKETKILYVEFTKINSKNRSFATCITGYCYNYSNLSWLYKI